MSPRTIRRAVVAVSVAGIAGMIVGSIAGNNGAALAAGLVTAAASLCLMVATAVATPPPAGVELREAALLEEQVAELVAEGADERRVRDLVRTATRLGRRPES
jgi:hypothetical protein